MTSPLNREVRRSFADYAARHFAWSVRDRVATVTLNRPDRKDPDAVATEFLQAKGLL